MKLQVFSAPDGAQVVDLWRKAGARAPATMPL
jgi:hypothetical protein